MCPFIRFARLSFAAILIFAISITATPAQQQSTTPPAPVPAQILAAQKCFHRKRRRRIAAHPRFPRPNLQRVLRSREIVGPPRAGGPPGRSGPGVSGELPLVRGTGLRLTTRTTKLLSARDCD